MIREVTIVPTILTNDKLDYRAQVEKINTYAKRVQIDCADGVFTQNETLDVSNTWWPKSWQVDLHLMYKHPSDCLETVLKLSPSLCIFHAEADEDLLPLYEALHARGIKCGVALLPSTYPGAVKQYIDVADHVLIFAGSLGSQGGAADMMQMEKIGIIRGMKPEVEIGWDGGANLLTMRALAHADLDVINVGSALAKAENPAEMYQLLKAEIDKFGVVL